MGDPNLVVLQEARQRAAAEQERWGRENGAEIHAALVEAFERGGLSRRAAELAAAGRGAPVATFEEVQRRTAEGVVPPVSDELAALFESSGRTPEAARLAAEGR